MNITFDAAKDEINKEKHRVSLVKAMLSEWDRCMRSRTIRREYGETQRGYAYIGQRLYCVMFVDRDEARRIISLRKANQREVKQYAEA